VVCRSIGLLFLIVPFNYVPFIFIFPEVVLSFIVRLHLPRADFTSSIIDIVEATWFPRFHIHLLVPRCSFADVIFMPRLPHSLPLSRGQALRLLVTRPQQTKLDALSNTRANPRIL
jgi:hypothetical protein